MEFCTRIQNLRVLAVERGIFQNLEIQDGGRPPS